MGLNDDVRSFEWAFGTDGWERSVYVISRVRGNSEIENRISINSKNLES